MWQYNTFNSVSRILPEKLIVTQLIKKFSTFCGSRKLLSVFRLFSILVKWIQCTGSYLISVGFFFTLFSHLRVCLISCLFQSGFPYKNIYAFSALPCVLPTPSVIFSFHSSKNTWVRASIMFPIKEYSPLSCHFFLLGSNILDGTPFWSTMNLCSSLNI
jgi:hypothetical protein